LANAPRILGMNDSNPVISKPFIHIKPRKGWQFIDFSELKEYRDLLYFLVLRDIKVKYKQTVLGGLWAIIQPFCSMVLFSLFFGKLAGIPSDGIPYPIFNYSALVAWTYFAHCISGSGSSIIGNSSLISKVYFPRVIIPLTPVLAGLLDFFIAFVVLIGMMFYFGIFPTTLVLILPFLVILMMITGSGVGMILGALTAKYRDFGYATPFLVQLWMFASPIVYPTSMIPEEYRFFYGLNPMTGIIEGFRSALLGTTPFPSSLILLSAVISISIFLLGLFYFKQMERHFADIL
jgi:lipopolysaccharide transport system permease protein